MIEGFRHKGLKRLYEQGDRSKVAAHHADKLERILARLDQAGSADDMDLPGYWLHPLKGDLKGFWSVTVSGNWRVVFRFAEGNVIDTDLIDYHQEIATMTMKTPPHPGLTVKFDCLEPLGLSVTEAADA